MTSEHGTQSRYTNGRCRCISCRRAHSDYSNEYARKQRQLARLAKRVIQAVEDRPKS